MVFGSNWNSSSMLKNNKNMYEVFDAEQTLRSCHHPPHPPTTPPPALFSFVLHILDPISRLQSVLRSLSPRAVLLFCWLLPTLSAPSSVLSHPNPSSTSGSYSIHQTDPPTPQKKKQEFDCVGLLGSERFIAVSFRLCVSSSCHQSSHRSFPFPPSLSSLPPFPLSAYQTL